ncbi:hypothetical protein HET69_30580 [Streptomyces sp. CJ_13]|uniref:hypothetical protein n=1 Tax=Streptomyces sp. CJ_13 TaxID=2724943 RepID=UPI001BDCEE1A|nr:hypothetical protein [Streptomyces sp. CJ_13]MBT1188206.1 hypothetical protein [Streptomyces sp. CJ_13]
MAVGERQPFKMRQARDANGLVISARQIGQKPEPFTRPLRCPYCEHEVTAQPEQPRISTKGTPFTRGAHFALAKEKEKGRPAEHLPGCALRTDHTLHAIARRSQGLAELKAGGLQLRLVLAATTDTKAPFLPPPGSPVLAPPADPVNLKIRTVEPVLPPAVTSAARIAQLLALYGNDPDDVAQFTVKHPGLRTPVPWTDFCFGPDRDHLARLYRQVAAGTIRHPVAVLGEVTATKSTDSNVSVRIATRIPTGLPGVLAHAEVYLRADAHRRQLLEPLTEGVQVLALAAPDVAWKVWRPNSSRLGHQVVLWPQAHWQIAYWTRSTAGLPAPPRSPNPLTEPPARPSRRTAPRRPAEAAPRNIAPTVPLVPQALIGRSTPPVTPTAAPPRPAVPPAPPTPPLPDPAEPTVVSEPLPPVEPPAPRARKGFLARWRRR